MKLTRCVTIITIVIVTSQILTAARKVKRPLLTGTGIGGGGNPVPIGPVPVDPTVPGSGSTADFDPTDLSNLLGHCSPVGTGPVNSVFNGMFMSPNELNNFVLTAQEELKQPKKRRLKQKNHVRSNKVSKTLGTIGTFSVTGSSENECCKTKMLVIAPGDVTTMDQQLMYAVHMNHSYQYFQIGECVEENAKCRTYGVCTQVYKTAFMLLYDPRLINIVQPPMTFGKVEMKSHCECMNVGRSAG